MSENTPERRGVRHISVRKTAAQAPGVIARGFVLSAAGCSARMWARACNARRNTGVRSLF
ncbi:hypothetical protein ACFQ2K_51455 [Streptomyces sanglieri]|uniref:Uncharacterized protein n=1 Tax=Streptomyces sanglieri TaxID=193460 RepID=A0ABW2XAJ0_9ACTN